MQSLSTTLSKPLLLLFGAIMSALTVCAQGVDVKINLSSPGELEREVDLIEATSINTLTISGTLNNSDLQTLRAAAGKLSTVKTLDISDARLETNESKPYVELYGGVNTLSNTYTYYYYYVSDNPRTEIDYGETGLGVGVKNIRCFCNNFSAVFNKTQAYTKIILPVLDSVGEELVSGNKVVEEIVIPEGPKYIGTGAFANATSLKRIDVPATVDSVGTHSFRAFTGEIVIKKPLRAIGYGAFRESSITSLDFSSLEVLDDHAFEGSKLAGSAALPNVSVIGESTFAKTGITCVITSPNLTEIGRSAFQDSKLEDIVFMSSSFKVGYCAFYGTPWYANNAKPDNQGIIYIGATAYDLSSSYDNNKKEIIIADGTTSLSTYLFNGKKNLEKINLPNSVKSIGDHTFQGTGLTSIEWPESLEEIGEDAFAYCYGLTFGAFPDNLKTIGYNAFIGCRSLLEITLPESLTSLASAFSDCTSVSLVKFNSKHLLSGEINAPNITHVVVGPKVEYLGGFSSKSKLRRVRFEERDADTPLTIEDWAFGNCSNLEDCLLPDNTIAIGGFAFSRSTKVNIGPKFPSKVTTVGRYAFEDVETPCEITDCMIDSVPDYAFFNWKGLTKASFSVPVRYLGNSSLAGTSISSFCLPALAMNGDVVTYPFSRGGWAGSSYCDSLKTITFESGATKFNVSLYGAAITDLVVPDGITEIMTDLPSSLTSLSLPVECLTFNDMPFKFNTKAAVSWRIPEGYVYEGDGTTKVIPKDWYANMNVPHADLILPEGIGLIDFNALHDTHLSKLSFPSTTIEIRPTALYNVTVDTLVFNGTATPWVTNAEILKNFKANVILVPFGRVQAYQRILGERDNIYEMDGELKISFYLQLSELRLNDRIYIQANLEPDIKPEKYTWHSSDESVVVIDEDTNVSYNYIRAVGYGECDITVEVTYHGKVFTASTHVICPDPDDSGIISVEADDDSMAEVYTVAGTLIATGKLSDMTLEPGIYIIKRKDKTEKICVR